MKKLIPIFIIATLLLSALFSFSGVALAAGESLDVKTETTELLEGGKVNFTATISNGDTTLTGYQIVCNGTVCYDSDGATLAPSETTNTPITFDYNVTTEQLDNPIEFSLVSGGATIATDSVTIAKKELSIKIGVSATVSTNLTAVGNPVNFTFTIENLGEATLDDIIVSAPELNGGEPLNDAFSLTSGQSYAVKYEHTMAGEITVNPKVTYSSGDTEQDPWNVESITVTEESRRVIPELTVDNKTPQPGEDVTFTLKITNEGNVPYTDMKVTLDGKEMDFPTTTLNKGDSESEEYTMSFTTSTDIEFTVSLKDHNGNLRTVTSNTISIELPVDSDSLESDVQFTMDVDRPQLTSEGTINFDGFISNTSEYELTNVSVDEATIGNVAGFSSMDAGTKENISWTADIDETTTYEFVLTFEDREGQEYTINADPITVTISSVAEATESVIDSTQEATPSAEEDTSAIIDPDAKSSGSLGFLLIIFIVLIVLIIGVGIALLILWKKGKPRGKTSATKMTAVKKKPAPKKKTANKKTVKNYRDRNNF